MFNYHSLDLVKSLLKDQSVDINEKNKHEETPLMRTLVSPECSVISLYLIQNGADVSVRNKYGKTPLHLAVRNNTELAHEIILKGANIDATDKNGYTPLHAAVISNNYESVCMLLYYNADANRVCRSSHMTPFMLSIRKYGRLSIQRLLLKYESNLNRQNKKGHTILFLAIKARSSILPDILEQMSLTVNSVPYFKNIFYTFDSTLRILYQNVSLLLKILKLEMEPQVWYKVLKNLIYSEFGPQLVLHCANNHKKKFFPLMFKKFKQHNISHEMLTPIVARCLTYGTEVRIGDIESACAFFGTRSKVLFLLITGTGMRPSDLLNNYSFANSLYPFCTIQLETLKLLLRLGTPSEVFKEKLKLSCERVLAKYGKESDKNIKCQEFLKIAQNMSLPTLMELSRDMCRRYISLYYGKGIATFYTTLRLSELPEIIKDYIKYELDIHYIS